MTFDRARAGRPENRSRRMGSRDIQHSITQGGDEDRDAARLWNVEGEVDLELLPFELRGQKAEQRAENLHVLAHMLRAR